MFSINAHGAHSARRRKKKYRQSFAHCGRSLYINAAGEFSRERSSRRSAFNPTAKIQFAALLNISDNETSHLQIYKERGPRARARSLLACGIIPRRLAQRYANPRKYFSRESETNGDYPRPGARRRRPGIFIPILRARSPEQRFYFLRARARARIPRIRRVTFMHAPPAGASRSILCPTRDAATTRPPSSPLFLVKTTPCAA